MGRVRFIKHGPSNGLRELSNTTGIPMLKSVGSRYRYRDSDIIINWGSSHTPFPVTLNNPSAVSIATNKLRTFATLSHAGMGSNLPKVRTNIEDAKELVREGKVYCRTLLSGSQGNGIVLATTEEEIVPAPLYTLQVKDAIEVRLHVFCGKVIDYAMKRKVSRERREAEGIEVDMDIRSHGRGWVFCREGVILTEQAEDVAVRAVSAVGLDFGAVDMLYNSNKAIVLEINTAPGLQGTTLASYSNAIQQFLNGEQI